MISSGINQYSGTIVRTQKYLILTCTIDYPFPNPFGPVYIFTFNGLTELVGATNLKIGLINPTVLGYNNYNLIGSTLRITAAINFSTTGGPFPPFDTIFSVSYTPAS